MPSFDINVKIYISRKPSFIEKFYKTVTRKKAVGYHSTFREEAYAPNSRWIGRSLLDITTTGEEI